MVLDEGQTVAAVAGELGLVVSTLGRWVRAARRRRREEWWAAQVAPAFGFLCELGFALTEVRGANWWQVCAVYRADPVAVLVVYSVEFGRVEAKLMRASVLDLPDLYHGRAFVVGVPGLGGHLADGLLTRPYPDREQRNKLIERYQGLEPDRVAAALEFWAQVLRDHATDYLWGDPSILDKWERGRESQVVTVHVPHSAAPTGAW
jgi:hypothetical protein